MEHNTSSKLLIVELILNIGNTPAGCLPTAITVQHDRHSIYHFFPFSWSRSIQMLGWHLRHLRLLNSGLNPHWLDCWGENTYVVNLWRTWTTTALIFPSFLNFFFFSQFWVDFVNVNNAPSCVTKNYIVPLFKLLVILTWTKKILNCHCRS